MFNSYAYVHTENNAITETNWYILGSWAAWKTKLSAWAAIHIYIVYLIYNI